MEYVAIFMKGWVIMSLTGANVKMIARTQYLGAFVISYAISSLWWVNSATASHTSLPYSQWVYAFGAGLGTVTGMSIVKWFSK